MEMTATAADEGRQARSAPVVCSTSDTALGNADVITLCKINADLAAETSGLRVSDGEGLCLLQRRLDHYQAIWLDARGVAHAAAGILSTNSVPGRRKLAALNE